MQQNADGHWYVDLSKRLQDTNPPSMRRVSQEVLEVYFAACIRDAMTGGGMEAAQMCFNGVMIM